MLPEPVIDFLQHAAAEARLHRLDPEASLFSSGVLDSFTLVDFVSLIETECGIRVEDADLRPENFDTLVRVEEFVERAKASV
jgi:acyl carrier protein